MPGPKGLRARLQSHISFLGIAAGVCALLGSQFFFYRVRLFSGDLRYVLVFLLFAALEVILLPSAFYLANRSSQRFTPKFSVARLQVGLLFAMALVVFFCFDAYSEHTLRLGVITGDVVCVGWFFFWFLCAPAKKPSSEPNASPGA